LGGGADAPAASGALSVGSGAGTPMSRVAPANANVAAALPNGVPQAKASGGGRGLQPSLMELADTWALDASAVAWVDEWLLEVSP